jgi:hypothetical protein
MWWAAASLIPEREQRMAKHGAELLKMAGTVAGLVVAVAAAASLLSVKAAPEPAGQSSAAQTSVKAGKTFASICKSGEVVDSRPDPKWVGASFAGDRCAAPAMPAAIDGASVQRGEIVAGMAAAKRYAVSADIFQACIRDYLAAERARADSEKKQLAMPLVLIENHRLLASEKDKKLVESRMRAAIVAFNEYGSECPD